MNYFESGLVNECCGCGTCMRVCPVSCIEMKADICGNVYPHINESLCIKCKRCEHVCPIANAERLKNESSDSVFALAVKDDEALERSTSGGAFGAIAKAFSDDNTVIFGAYMSEDLTVKHGCVDSIEKIDKFRKSKYVKSELGSSFEIAKQSLNSGKKVLFSGTPCQIAALKSFLGKEYEGLLTIDLVCHGAPNAQLFQSYVNALSKKYRREISSVTMRIKKDDTEYGMKIVCGKKTKILYPDEDMWMTAFFKRLSQMESCGTCPFADTKRVADITLGDFWGIRNIDASWNAGKGVSAVIPNTLKGAEILNKIENATIKEYKIIAILQYNQNLNKAQSLHSARVDFQREAMSDFSVAIKKYAPLSFKSKLKIAGRKIIPLQVRSALRSILK